MTGLDLGADALIEVAALVTDFELNVLGEGVDLIIRPPAEALEQMTDFVREMHVKSGLLEELADGITMADAEQQVLAYIKQHCPDGSRPPLAGNTVATDRAFLARDMTRSEEHTSELQSLMCTADAHLGVPHVSPPSFPHRLSSELGVDRISGPPAEALEQMTDVVREMHVKSGLLWELADGITIADAEQQVLAYIKQHCPDGSRPPLAGNTVATDRAFLARDMTELESFLHYRIVDVSSIKELSRDRKSTRLNSSH